MREQCWQQPLLMVTKNHPMRLVGLKVAGVRFEVEG